MDLYAVLLLAGALASVVGTVVVTVRDGYRPVPFDPCRAGRALGDRERRSDLSRSR